MGAFDSDRTENKNHAKGQIAPSTIPNAKVTDTDFAFLVQRADLPQDFKGIITAQWIEGSEALKPYLSSISAKTPDELTAEQKAVLAAIRVRSTTTEAWASGALPNWGGVQAIAPLFAVDVSPAISTPTYELPNPGNNFLDFNVSTTVGKTYRLVFGAIGTATGNVTLRSNNNAENYVFTGPGYAETHPGISVSQWGSMFVFVYEFRATEATFVSRITSGCPYNQGPVLIEVGQTDLYDVTDGTEKRFLNEDFAPDLSGKADKSVVDALSNRVNGLSASNDVKGVVNIASDRYVYKSGKIYGVRRARSGDSTGTNTNLASVDHSAINGNDTVTLFYNASYQWLTYEFDPALTTVWDVAIRYENITAGSSPSRFKVNGTKYNLSKDQGIYTYNWSAPGAGARLSSVSYEEATSRSYLHDLKIRISDSAVPSYVDGNGLVNALAVGDSFRLVGQGLSALCRYDGIDPRSGAWSATPSELITPLDSALTIGSKNGVENNAIALRFQEVVGSVPDAGNSLEKLYNLVQSSGQDWIIVDTIAERDALDVTDVDGKYVRVLDSRKATDGSTVWSVYYARAVHNNDPAIAPTIDWILLFDQENGGSADLGLEFGKLQTENTALKARVTALEAKPTPSPQILNIDRDFIESDFDSNEWIQANSVIKDYVAWTWKTQLYFRTGTREVKPMFPDTWEPMPDPNHNNAIALGNGVFESRLRGGATIQYTTPKTTRTTDRVTFPAGVYSDFLYILIDANGDRVGTFGSNKNPIPAAFTGQSFDFSPPAPVGVVAIRVILTRNGVDEFYDYPV